MLHFVKYHALGNDYLVVESSSGHNLLTAEQIRRICHRNYGLGADGILVGTSSPKGNFTLTIWNPDGTEAEKSGNGLRIFARYLWDEQYVAEEPFKVCTKGGIVTCLVEDQGKQVTVDMGRVSFLSSQIPVAGPEREVLRETLAIQGSDLEFSAATIGNPHCVLLRDRVSPEEARTLGPLIERDPRFPHRTNVQFVQVLDRHNVAAEVWERGAGYTLASGSSGCAVAGVVVRLGLCDSPVTVQMPGGDLSVVVDDRFLARMTGPVCKIAEGDLADETWQDSRRTHDLGEFSLLSFQRKHTGTILSWILDGNEASDWAGLDQVPRDPAILEQCHADPDVHAWVLMQGGDPVGYGEIWGFESDTVELARIIIAPALRNRKLARILIDKLCETLPVAESRIAVLRVQPNNVRALRCYEGAGFHRVPSEREALYNVDQPINYVWMSRTIDDKSIFSL